jgi:hypothetical protein
MRSPSPSRGPVGRADELHGGLAEYRRASSSGAGGRWWLLGLAGLLVGVLFATVLWYAYLEGLAGVGGEPPLVRAEPAPTSACLRTAKGSRSPSARRR